MSGDQSVTRWLDPLAQGDEQAAQALWGEYYDKLVRLARHKLRGARRRASDEEDVALSAFHSFCRGAAAGKFPQLEDRDNLWKLLVVITARKAIAHEKRERRQKRGGGKVHGESVFQAPGAVDLDVGMHQAVGSEPTPEFAAVMVEEHQRLLASLGEELGRIAQWKLEGFTNAEIAAKIDRSERAVERKLRLIREEWSRDCER